MKEEQQRFLLLLGHLPAHLTAEQAAWVLNSQPHDVPILVAVRLHKPLGNPPPNSVKFFAASNAISLHSRTGKIKRAGIQSLPSRLTRPKSAPVALKKSFS